MAFCFSAIRVPAVAVRPCGISRYANSIARAQAGAHADFQLAIRAGKSRRTEIERDGKDTIVYGDIFSVERRACLIATHQGVKETELYILTAPGRRTRAGQFTLISEGEGLGEGCAADETPPNNYR